MDGKSWNVGVVGYGMSAKTFHIPFVTQLPELKLYAVVQRSPTPADDAATDHPGIKAYRNAQDMVRDAAVDVVVVTTAPDSHFELVKLALAAGKHGMRPLTLPALQVCLAPRLLLTATALSSCLREAIHANVARGSRASRHCAVAKKAAGCLPE